MPWGPASAVLVMDTQRDTQRLQIALGSSRPGAGCLGVLPWRR